MSQNDTAMADALRAAVREVRHAHDTIAELRLALQDAHQTIERLWTENKQATELLLHHRDVVPMQRTGEETL